MTGEPETDVLTVAMDAATLPGLPRDDDGPVFREPWEAAAFALAVRLIDTGIVTWPEWAAALGARLEETGRKGTEGDVGECGDYYHHWLAALEDITAAKGLSKPGDLAALRQEWRSAYLATPHGEPVTLPGRPGEL